jgi:hypothetical protein
VSALFDDIHNPRLRDLPELISIDYTGFGSLPADLGIARSEVSTPITASEPMLLVEQGLADALDRLGELMVEHRESCTFGMTGCTGDFDGAHEDSCPAWLDTPEIDAHVLAYMDEVHAYIAEHAEWIA